MLNILNILLTHKYTQHSYTSTRIEELKSVHLKCTLFAFSSMSATKIYFFFNFPR